MHLIGISTNDWSGQWMNRQHMMWALKELCPVLYVQEPESWNRSWRCRDERFLRASLSREDQNLSVMRLPKYLALRSRDGKWNDGALRRKAELIRRQLAGLPGPRILYHWHPQLWDYCRLLEPDLTIFHLFDLMPAHHEEKFKETRSRQLFDRACREADLMLAGTPQQANAIARDQIEILPNGVPFEWYGRDATEPPELAKVPRPRIGYIGSLSSARDFGWLRGIADNPDWHLVLAGCAYSLNEDDRMTFVELCARPNVTYLGELPSRRVPEIMQSLDVGLMCYRRNGFHEHASPIKLFEYCAAGLPVVGARLESLAADPHARRFIQFADTAEEAVAAIAEILASPNRNADRQARRDFGAANSWRQRATQVMTHIRSRFPHTTPTGDPVTPQLLATAKTV